MEILNIIVIIIHWTDFQLTCLCEDDVTFEDGAEGHIILVQRKLKKDLFAHL